MRKTRTVAWRTRAVLVAGNYRERRRTDVVSETALLGQDRKTTNRTLGEQIGFFSATTGS
eukprot:scaffold3077_cov162-Amphora_coffeaeformis.AAC.37